MHRGGRISKGWLCTYLLQKMTLKAIFYLIHTKVYFFDNSEILRSRHCICFSVSWEHTPTFAAFFQTKFLYSLRNKMKIRCNRIQKDWSCLEGDVNESRLIDMMISKKQSCLEWQSNGRTILLWNFSWPFTIYVRCPENFNEWAAVEKKQSTEAERTHLYSLISFSSYLACITRMTFCEAAMRNTRWLFLKNFRHNSA